MALARAAGAGVTTLPAQEEHLAARIARTVAALAQSPRRPGAEEYLFVVEGDGGRIVATSAAIARVGGFDPFYTYEVRSERVCHPPLGVDRTIESLHLRREHKGPSELCGLVVDPAARGRGVGRLASLGRLLFVAAQRARFDDRTIAEIRGDQDAAGRSPFWDAVGRVFFAPADFAEADLLTGLGEKDFVADLMPRHPIYLDLLPSPVRKAIGRPHPAAVPAMSLLEAEGFARTDEVDIFDAGPILAADTDRIRTVRAAREGAVAAIGGGGQDALVGALGDGFRASVGRARVAPDGAVTVEAALADTLAIGIGDAVVAAPLPARG